MPLSGRTFRGLGAHRPGAQGQRPDLVLNKIKALPMEGQGTAPSFVTFSSTSVCHHAQNTCAYRQPDVDGGISLGWCWDRGQFFFFFQFLTYAFLLQPYFLQKWLPQLELKNRF